MNVLDLHLRAHGPLTDMDIAQLGALGLRVFARLVDGGYRVRGESAASMSDVLALPFVAAAAPFQPYEKLDATLASLTQLPEASRTGDAPRGTAAAQLDTPLLVTLDAAVDQTATVRALEVLGEVLSLTKRRVVLRTSAQRIPEVAGLDAVLHVEIEPDTHTQ